MSSLLDKLIDKEGNVYEMTCVAIKEANVIQATDLKDEIEKNGGKVTTHVLEKELNDEIKYTTGKGK